MKRTIIASILGVVASLGMVASSYGQGSIWFDNYNNANVSGPNSGFSSPISIQGGGLIPSSFTVDLYYALGTVTDPNAGNPLASPIGSLLLSRPVSATAPGYVSAAIATALNYVSGPITFQVAAHGTLAGQDYFGRSAVLTLPSIATGTTLPGYLDGLQSFSVQVVPEPTTFALAGIGSAMLLIFRRRNA